MASLYLTVEDCDHCGLEIYQDDWGVWFSLDADNDWCAAADDNDHQHSP